MRVVQFLLLLFALSFFNSCIKSETAHEILQTAINSIDTIETIYFKQEMARTNPQNANDTILRFREMYFARCLSDSIVGVKGHWYMYVDDKINVIYEDIYDGNRLVRKNNRDSVARVYDLIKYPGFKNQHFWGHNTLYGMQYEFRYILEHLDNYSLERLNDTLLQDKLCFRLFVKLEEKTSMPGFATRLEDSEGNISETLYVIEKETYYPIRMTVVSYFSDSPEQKTFIDQTYYDIEFNLKIDDSVYFCTSVKSLKGYKMVEMKPS